MLPSNNKQQRTTADVTGSRRQASRECLCPNARMEWMNRWMENPQMMLPSASIGGRRYKMHQKHEHRTSNNHTVEYTRVPCVITISHFLFGP